MINTAIALLSPAAEAMIIDDSTPKNRSFIYAVDYWAMNLSIMFGSMIGGMFFNEYRFELFTLLSLSSLVVLYIILGMINIGELKSAITAKALVWQS